MDEPKVQEPTSHGPHGEGCDCLNGQVVITLDYSRNPHGVVEAKMELPEGVTYQQLKKITEDLDRFVLDMRMRVLCALLGIDISTQGGSANVS